MLTQKHDMLVRHWGVFDRRSMRALRVGAVPRIALILGLCCSVVLFSTMLVANESSKGEVMIPLLLLLCLLLLQWLIRHSWVEPSVLFSAFWSANILATLVFAPDYQIKASGCWWILASCVSVACGDLLSHPPVSLRSRLFDKFYLEKASKATRIIVGLSLVLGLLYMFLLIVSYTSVLDIQSDSLSEFASEVSRYRYSGGSLRQIGTQVFLVFVYLGPLFSGLFYHVAMRRQERLLYLTSLLPSLAIAVLQTTRATFLWAAILWISGYLAFRVLQGTDRCIGFHRQTIVPVVAGGVLVVLLFGVLQLLRGGQKDILAGLALIIPRLRPWFFGHVSAFSIWFDQCFPNFGPPLGGARTIAGVFDVLKISTRERGLYSEFVVISSSNASTNVYTVFRGLIEDFSIPGSMAFFFVFGLVCGRSYFNIRYKKLLTWIPLLSWGYMYTLWPVTSIFNYNSILVAWAGFALCFLMMGRENI
jgi:oligosaccharide repeat unit polymerase